jgi:glutamine synthetase
MEPFESRIAAIDTRLLADDIRHLLVQFVDIHGAAKVKMIPASGLRMACEEGAGFAGAAIWGMGQGPHSHDLFAVVDLDTYTPLPFEPGVARFASDLHVDGRPHPYCPRVNLRRMIARLAESGYVFNVGIEPEFFLVTRAEDGSIEGWDPDGVDGLSKPCYDYKSMAAASNFLRELHDGLDGLGWGVYQIDHEDANSQFEVNFKYADALTTADRLIFFRMAATQLARRHGAVATFMAKPFAARTGSGAHMHYHLADAKTGDNAFLDERDPRGLGLSETAYHFLGGVLHHARAICAVASPTVNCYKRLLSGAGLTASKSGFTWVPAYLTYGDSNRTQMLRVPEGGHVEDRTVSGACNPYLVIAAYLAAGLDGIERRLDPGPPNAGNLYEAGPAEMARRGIGQLPQSLPEALDAFEADQVVREGLGPIADELIALKRAEWREYHAEVGRWEIRRYLTAL